MDARVLLAEKGRDTRIDLFRGIANWCIFLDHIPDNAVSLLTLRNFGFSGAADLFIFIAGYAAAMTYARMMRKRGFLVGATRLLGRAWRTYIAYLVLFVIYIVTVAYVAQQYAAPDIIGEFNVTGLVDHPIRTLGHGLMLQSKPRNMDVLQVYILLMALFAPLLWIMLRAPRIVMVASVALYLAARGFGWNLPSFPDGDWYFNPFCWQLLFVLGAWLALAGAQQIRAFLRSPLLLCCGLGYLVFALVMTMAGNFPEFGQLFPGWLVGAFYPSDKVNLAPYRLLHFLFLALVVTRYVSKDWRGLKWPLLQPVIRCGEQAVPVFCIGVFLSFIGHFVLTLSSGSLMMQVVVSATGIAIMTLVAYYISWSEQVDSGSHPARGEVETPALGAH